MTYPVHRKKIFRHGGSKAIDLPKDAKFETGDVLVEVRESGVFIYSDPLTTMESDPRFHAFVEAIFQDAMAHPDQLKHLEDVWDKEWDDLLGDVDGGNET